MKMMSAGLALLALVAAEPAFAGCGSHGGGGYRSRVVKAPIVSRKVVQKPKAQSSARAVAAADVGKPEAKSSASVANTPAADDSASKTAQSAAAQCKEYSSTVGAVIAVPCS